MGQSERIDSPTLVEQAEFAATPSAAEEHDEGESLDWLAAVRIVLVGLGAAAVWLHLWEPFAHVSLIGAVGVLIGGWPVFKEAAMNVAAQRMTMELSMSIAIVAAAAISEFFTALVITLFVHREVDLAGLWRILMGQ